MLLPSATITHTSPAAGPHHWKSQNSNKSHHHCRVTTQWQTKSPNCDLFGCEKTASRKRIKVISLPPWNTQTRRAANCFPSNPRLRHHRCCLRHHHHLHRRHQTQHHLRSQTETPKINMSVKSTIFITNTPCHAWVSPKINMSVKSTIFITNTPCHAWVRTCSNQVQERVSTNSVKSQNTFCKVPWQQRFCSSRLIQDAFSSC